MDYEGRICRSPMEKDAFMLPITVGCPYNACSFCNLFRDLRYRELPFQKIEAELKRVKACGGNPHKIFLGDGCAFSLQTEKLLTILDSIHSYFPNDVKIHSDATVSSILSKTDKELKALADKGYTLLYIGIESGLEEVLQFMHKEHSVEEAELAIQRVQNAGMEYAAHIMTGVAGRGRGEENAEAMADFLKRTKPEYLVNFSLFLSAETPLYHSIMQGDFLPATELENLQEDYKLIQLLTKDTEQSHPIYYESFHDGIQKRIRGKFPDDGMKMMDKVKGLIEEYSMKDAIYACDFPYGGGGTDG